MLVWLSVWSKVQTCIWPSCCHCHSLSLASVKSRLVLPFWYRLTWVVPEKGPLNGCVCVYALVLFVISDRQCGSTLEYSCYVTLLSLHLHSSFWLPRMLWLRRSRHQLVRQFVLCSIICLLFCFCSCYTQSSSCFVVRVFMYWCGSPSHLSVWDCLGGPIPEETFTHSHPSWSWTILCQLPPSTTIHSTLLV